MRTTIPKPSTIELSCVIVSVNYGDYLSITLPENKRFIKHTVVVTSPTDEETIKVCLDNQIQCLKYDKLATQQEYMIGQQKASSICKGEAINAGMEATGQREWILSMDADVVLPDNFMEEFEKAKKNRELLWGANRYMCKTRAAWMKYKLSRDVEGLTLEKHTTPIGFFQLFNMKSSTMMNDGGYPKSWGIQDDVLFLGRWTRDKMGVSLPLTANRLLSKMMDLNVIHLGLPYTDWWGRRAPKFVKTNNEMTHRYKMGNKPKSSEQKIIQWSIDGHGASVEEVNQARQIVWQDIPGRRV